MSFDNNPAVARRDLRLRGLPAPLRKRDRGRGLEEPRGWPGRTAKQHTAPGTGWCTDRQRHGAEVRPISLLGFWNSEGLSQKFGVNES